MRKIMCFLKKLASPAVIAELAGTVYLIVTVIEHHTENGMGSVGIRGVLSVICAILTVIGVVCSPEGQKNAFSRSSSGKISPDVDKNVIGDLVDDIARIEALVERSDGGDLKGSEVKSNDGQ